MRLMAKELSCLPTCWRPTQSCESLVYSKQKSMALDLIQYTRHSRLVEAIAANGHIQMVKVDESFIGNNLRVPKQSQVSWNHVPTVTVFLGQRHWNGRSTSHCRHCSNQSFNDGAVLEHQWFGRRRHDVVRKCIAYQYRPYGATPNGFGEEHSTTRLLCTRHSTQTITAKYTTRVANWHWSWVTPTLRGISTLQLRETVWRRSVIGFQRN